MKTVKAWAIVREDGEYRKDYGGIAHLWETRQDAIRFNMRPGDKIVRVEIRAIKPRKGRGK
jgi:hypothetical protein